MRTNHVVTPFIAGAAVIGLGASSAGAGLLIDVRAQSKNGVAVSNPKLVSVQPGDTVLFRVFADVTGADDSLPDCFQSLTGSFLSTGGILGNLAPVTGAGITAPFGGSGSSGGQQTDLDGDGDLDVGSNNPADPSGFVAFRAAELAGPRTPNPPAGNLGGGDFPHPIPHGTEYRIVTSLRMFITGSGTQAGVNFRPRISNTGGLWAEDAQELSTVIDNGDGTFQTLYGYTGGNSFTDTSLVQMGSPVILVPEPAALGLALLAGLGLLVRRRSSTSSA
jgi:MYXO-CTERM domain-containing protein